MTRFAPFLLLSLVACASEEPLVVESEEDFFRAYAELSCDQLMHCEPDSWRGREGHPVCFSEEKRKLSVQYDQPCISVDLAKAQECVDEIAVLACHQEVLDGFLPPSCWEVQVWNESDCWDTGFGRDGTSPPIPG